MESKVTIFVVFAVFAQSSLATNNQGQFVTDLLTIREAGQNTYNALEKVINGYSAIMNAFANVDSEKEECDEETLATRNNTLQEQIAAFNTAYDTTRDGLRPIAGNATALTANEEEIYATLEAWLRLVDTVFDLFPTKNYSETQVAIEDIEKVAIPEIGDILIQVYEVIRDVINSEDLDTNNVISTITRTATGGTKNAFSLVFGEFQAFLIKLFGKTEAQCEACLSVMETQKSLALALLKSEDHTKFTLFQYVATADFLNDTTIITDLNKIQAAIGAVATGFEYAVEPVFNALIELATHKKLSSTTETLKGRLSSGFDLAFVNTLIGISYIKPKGSATITIDEATGFLGIDIMVEGIIAAFESIQNTNTSGDLAEIETIKKEVVSTAIGVFEDLFRAIEDAVSDIDSTLKVAAKRFRNKSSVFVESGFRNIFAAIEILAPQDTSISHQDGCADDIIRIKTAYTAVLSDLYSEMSLKFDFIRAARLYYTLKANEISVPLSSLLYEPY